MTCIETDLPPFDPSLQPIGFALANELLDTETAAALAVVVPFTTSATASETYVDWFVPCREPGHELGMPASLAS